MRKIAPKHVEIYCYEDKKDKVYTEICKYYKDEYVFVYKIKCSCGKTIFNVYEDEHPSIFLQCCNCNEKIVVYDLKFYPAAIKLKDFLTPKQVVIDYLDTFEIYVIYEYSDEFAFDDVQFDQNDISWGTVFIKNGKFIKKILDDETT